MLSQATVAGQGLARKTRELNEERASAGENTLYARVCTLLSADLDLFRCSRLPARPHGPRRRSLPVQPCIPQHARGYYPDGEHCAAEDSQRRHPYNQARKQLVRVGAVAERTARLTSVYRTINLGKYGSFPTSELVGQPYGLTYEIVDKKLKVLPPRPMQEVGTSIIPVLLPFPNTVLQRTRRPQTSSSTTGNLSSPSRLTRLRP